MAFSPLEAPTVTTVRENEPVPFGSVVDCPACGTNRWDISYHGIRCVSAPEGLFVEVGAFGEGEAPHLHQECGRCGFSFQAQVRRP